MPYVHLSLEERYVIYHLVGFGVTLREIGRRLGRHHTTIGRELKRNVSRSGAGDYWHESAHRRATARFGKARHRRRRGYGRLYRYVIRRLEREWSPEQIAGRLGRDYRDDARMRVSPETIYLWIYRQAAAGGELFRHLRRAHKKRRRQGRYGTGRGLIPGRVSIAERPDIVAGRHRLGDWEGDCVEGAIGKGGLVCHVERKSRYLIAAKLADKTANTLADQTIHAFRSIPRAWRRTLTVDNGKEFARFKRIEIKTGLAVYFADPYAPWKRGTNENTNGLIRQYFPKGCDFRDVSDNDLARAVAKLNHRPRKSLAYRTPHEALHQANNGALQT